MDLPQTIRETVAAINSRHFSEAITLCTAALQLNPNHIGCLNLLGVALRGLGNFPKSIETHRLALALEPENIESLLYLGEVQVAAQQTQDAASCFLKATQLQPRSGPAWNALGHSHTLLKRFPEAIASLQKAVEMEPANPDFLNRLGIALRNSNQINDAIQAYLKALQLRPDFPQALNNLGAAYQIQNRPNEALATYNKALSLNPENLSAWNNLGALLQEQHHLKEAIQAYQKAQSIDPKFFQAHANEGHARLLLGDFPIGWLKHEYRWLALRKNPQRSFTVPLWRGEDLLKGKSILLHSEQGLGDTIQFVRYASILAAAGATVHLEVQRSLKALVSSVPGVSSTHEYGESLPPFDFHSPLMSLPLATKTTLETIPKNTPYLFPSTASVEKWAATVPKGKRAKVGLVWRGNPEHHNDANRSIPLDVLAGLLDVTDVDFVNLQLELTAEEQSTFSHHTNCSDPARGISDYGDTAALISQLDLVICADTSVAHLAGALSKPVWILLPFSPDWRWMLNRDDTPWYPSARLFRQSRPQEWAPVIGKVRSLLRTFLGASENT